MFVIAGLGNPGKEYDNTRHNVGFMFVDFLAAQLNVQFQNKFFSHFAETQIHGEKVVLLKPQTFMNESGKALEEIIRFYKLTPDQIWIAFDDLDIQFGLYKVQKGKYPKVHNGINDIIQKCSTDAFNYIRIGIDDRSSEERRLIPGRNYVLQHHSNSYNDVFNEIAKQLMFLAK